MRRVMIIGQPGSGKSTLARAVAEIAHLPLIHADHLHWKSGWVERDQAEKTTKERRPDLWSRYQNRRGGGRDER